MGIGSGEWRMWNHRKLNMDNEQKLEWGLEGRGMEVVNGGVWKW